MINDFPFKPKLLHPSWGDFIYAPKVQAILNSIYEEIHYETFFPEEQNVLRFMNTDIRRAKYIIVGMDPYPSTYDWFDVEIGEHIEKPVATGRSFEIANVDSWLQKYKQTSLRNILKTIYYNETGIEASLLDIQKSIINKSFPILPPHEWFNRMEEQGVMFLNSTLTVRKDHPGSHEKYWEEFMDLLVCYVENKNDKVKWVLWGNKAIDRFDMLVNNSIKFKHPRVHAFVRQNCFKTMDDIDWLGKEKEEPL